ncbi:MAG: hypothetical protein R3185_02105, partial [Candidatus Thermoplasmatota archaeon]|nr:hypothetical protein [Candidatus Thermoplasmatota archaeon]
MPQRFVVDTSWLYALFDAADAHHATALKQSGRPGHYVVPSEILAETLLLRHSRARQARLDPRSEARRLARAIQEAGFAVEGSDAVADALA